MGPSGSGKTTLLNYLASRPAANDSTTSGNLLINGAPPSAGALRSLTRFVEQEDALVGALTARETLHFASRLAGARGDHGARIDELLDAFGLRDQADTLVGTALTKKGLSGGQKRRLGVASQLITRPKALFLDEPTSGLDSVASWEVVKYLRAVAKREGVSLISIFPIAHGFCLRCFAWGRTAMEIKKKKKKWKAWELTERCSFQLIVIASIHQPSTATFNLFDKLLLLSHGKMHYFGPVSAVAEHYASLGCPVPLHVNPAEFLLELVNTDFASERETALQRLEEMHRAWDGSRRAKELAAAVAYTGQNASMAVEFDEVDKKPGLPRVVLTLLHRSFIKSYRDVVVYGVRLAMYTGEESLLPSSLSDH
jgi:ABC-type multidrug transport system ATPase subunit